jgi:hypothetical protein
VAAIANRHTTSFFALLLLLLLLPALLYLLQPGFFVTDDGRFHVYRTAGLAQAWQLGVIHPRLFPHFGFGYGQAVLNFYSPLSYWPGALLSILGMSPAGAVQVTVALSFILAALAAFAYARYLWGPLAGLLAGLAYSYFPFHLADAYVRGAFPEHLAFLLAPLILYAYTRAFREQGSPWPPMLWGTLFWTGLVFTHNLSVVLLAPVAVAHLLLLAVWTGRWRRLLGAAGSLALAVAMSAVYWLPVWVEGSAVGIGLGPSQGYSDHLLALGDLILRAFSYVYRDLEGLGLVYPLDWLSVFLLGLVTLVLIWRGWKRQLPANAPLLAFHLAVAGAAIFLLTRAALPVWRLLEPVLGYLQYPWRYLLLVDLGLLAAAGALPVLLPKVRPAIWVGSLTAAVLLVSLPGLRPEPLELPAADVWSPDRMWREDAEVGQVGATWTGEFLPLAVTEQRWALGRSREAATDGVPLTPAPAVALAERTYDSFSLQVDSPAAWRLRLHQFQQPGWQATIDGQEVPTYPTGEMALVTVDIPAGSHQVIVRFGGTAARRAGAIVSGLAVLLWVGLAWWRARPRRLLLAATLLLLLVSGMLALNALGVGRHRWTPVPAQAKFADMAVLLGRDVAPALGADALDVTLYWLALRDSAIDYVAFVHLVDEEGRVIAQHDGQPVGGFTPTTRWRAGELISDRHRILLSPDLAPGTYSLKAGLYELADGPRNLAVDPPTADNRADLGTVEIP